jgi:hypothetical protein
MRTVIVRLSDPSGDGQLHGLVEVVGEPDPRPFTDDGHLLELLRDVGQEPAPAPPT